jgi:hypothetical protein
MQAPQNTPPPNFGMLILLALCVWAAMKDRAYKKAGGIKPDRFEKILLLATTVGCIFVLFAIGLRSPAAAGTLTPVLVVAAFGAWEIYRYRIRKKNPAGGIPR